MAKLSTEPSPADREKLRGVLNIYRNQFGQIVARKWPGRKGRVPWNKGK